MRTFALHDRPGRRLPGKVAAVLLAAVACLLAVGTRASRDDEGPADGQGVLGKAVPASCCDPEQRTCPTAGETRSRYTRTEGDYQVPDVRLVDQRSRPVEIASELNRDGPVVLQFAFTTCSTVCPVLTGTMAAARRGLGDRAKGIRIMTISIDPEHDKPERLRAFAKSFDAGPEWTFCTGRLDDVIALQKAFDAYPGTGNKMRHEPLTFIRPAPGRPWVRINGLCPAKDLVHEIELLIDKDER